MGTGVSLLPRARGVGRSARETVGEGVRSLGDVRGGRRGPGPEGGPGWEPRGAAGGFSQVLGLSSDSLQGKGGTEIRVTRRDPDPCPPPIGRPRFPRVRGCEW